MLNNALTAHAILEPQLKCSGFRSSDTEKCVFLNTNTPTLLLQASPYITYYTAAVSPPIVLPSLALIACPVVHGTQIYWTFHKKKKKKKTMLKMMDTVFIALLIYGHWRCNIYCLRNKEAFPAELMFSNWKWHQKPTNRLFSFSTAICRSLCKCLILIFCTPAGICGPFKMFAALWALLSTPLKCYL